MSVNNGKAMAGPVRATVPVSPVDVGGPVFKKTVNNLKERLGTQISVFISVKRHTVELTRNKRSLNKCAKNVH